MVMGNSFKDVSERVTSMFGWRTRESMKAFSALKYSKFLEAVVSLPFFGCVFRSAFGTRRVWLCG